MTSRTLATIALGVALATTAFTVPESASWTLMLIGFAGLGYTLRSRRKLARARA